MSAPVCPCDGPHITAPVNLPALPGISYRVGTYLDFRRAVLTPLPGEQTLSVNGVPVWRTSGAGDLGVMFAEWFAYVADVLTFYNERIANQAYLRTADQPQSVTRLIALLGYRPRPAIGAAGTLAALVSPGQSAVLPKGLQIQSKPSPGQPPQTFELSADTAIGAPDQIAATPAPVLLADIGAVPVWVRSPYRSSVRFRFGLYAPAVSIVAGSDRYTLALRGAVDSVQPGSLLALRPRDPATGDPLLATLKAATIAPAPAGGQQTTLTVTLSDTPPDGLSAAQAALETANQSIPPWSLFGGAIDGGTVHLASLARQIRPGDWVLFTKPSHTPVLAQVQATAEAVWDATGSAAAPGSPADGNQPAPIPHTVLTLADDLPAGWSSNPGSVTVRFGWVSVGKLQDQPFQPWTGAPAALQASTAQQFPAMAGLPVLLQDSMGAGIAALGSSAGDGTVSLGQLPAPVPPLLPPFQVLTNLLPVTRGKTVAREVLGSGDATLAFQDFALKQSPVTYLPNGAGWASTIGLTVGGRPWTEVASFYGQPPDAQVFVTREDESGSTHVMFGDGVNGARLPSGANNVVATYRVGAGAAAPPAGKLTVMAQSWPGLRGVLNPVAVGGGADADPPAQIRRYAPRSVLAFGRAVSAFDYEALAGQAHGVTRARAVWAWNDARQRTVVTVYVGDDAAARDAANSVLAAAGDPNRPVQVVLATEIPVALLLTLAIVPGMDADAISASVVTALTDADTGLFSAWNLAIGQSLFDSRIEAAVLGVPGAVAITAAQFIAAGALDAGPLHDPGEGSYFTLDPLDITLTTEPDSHGG